MTLSHVLMTPFNVRRKGDEGRGSDRSWLEHRLPFFEGLCAPSVAAQTAHHFRWLIFVDPDTPSEPLSRIEAAAAGVDHEVVPIPRFEDMAAAVSHRFAAPRLTSRLDNDDALERTHMERTLAAVEAGARTVVFTSGVVLLAETGRAYRLRQRHSPFFSFLSSDPSLTAATADQGQIFTNPPSVELSNGFLRVIHGRNMWGTSGAVERRVGSRFVYEHFAIDPGLVQDETGPRYWADVVGSRTREIIGRGRALVSSMVHEESR